jgi:hypothetical protein
MGPDHPQKEVYEESKHGIQFFANEDKMNLDSPKWIVGEDYSAAPTCATCHMSATKNQPVTHDVGMRISWNNRPPISIRPELSDKFGNKIDFTWFELWHHEGRRARHAAAMMGPDYTHWHGTYEIARNFYTEFIPELEELVEKGMHSGDADKVAAAEKLQAAIDETLATDDHKWFIGEMDPAEAAARKKAAEEFKARYKD